MLRKSSLRICTDIGPEKPASLPATKSLKETYSQDMAEVRALGQLTGDSLQTTSWHSPDAIRQPVRIASDRGPRKEGNASRGHTEDVR